jgi:hypothetical protein
MLLGIIEGKTEEAAVDISKIKAELNFQGQYSNL